MAELRRESIELCTKISKLPFASVSNLTCDQPFFFSFFFFAKKERLIADLLPTSLRLWVYIASPPLALLPPSW